MVTSYLWNFFGHDKWISRISVFGPKDFFFQGDYITLMKKEWDLNIDSLDREERDIEKVFRSYIPFLLVFILLSLANGLGSLVAVFALRV